VEAEGEREVEEVVYNHAGGVAADADAAGAAPVVENPWDAVVPGAARK